MFRGKLKVGNSGNELEELDELQAGVMLFGFLGLADACHLRHSEAIGDRRLLAEDLGLLHE